MSEVIKLFGKTIHFPMRQEVSGNNETSVSDTDATFDYIEGCSYYQKLHYSSTTSTLEDNSAREENEDENENEKEKGSSEKELTSDNSNGLEPNDPTISSGISENPKTSSIERETSSLKTFKSEEQSETSISQEKTLKKPEKILPCPRCHSMDTKFCYFNNYNVSQPRHFCKNCQRYWTAGGSMRNVPIGAGRRKNKNSSASSYRDLVMSDPLRVAQANGSNRVYNPCSGINRTILNFGSDSPPWESKTSVLNLAETKQNYIPNEFHRQAQRVVGSSDRGGKSITDDNGGFPPPQVPCFPGPPWSCPWNPVQWTPGLLPPAMYNSGFPISFYPPPAFWGSWNTCFPQSSTINHSSPSCPNSHTLGKHSRDGNIILNQCNSQREEPTKDNNDADRIPLIPKTLRINDPNEAAKSSIWATLGIKYDQTNYPNGGEGGGFVKAFQSKGNEKTRTIETSPFLQANPAALSRSLNFHERT